MLLLLFDLPGGVECFKEEGVEERRGFCSVEWFVEKKKKLSVVSGGVVIRGSKQA